MLSTIGSTNDRRNTSGRSGQGEWVGLALGGRADGLAGHSGSAAADLPPAGQGDRGWTGNHKTIEVESYLENKTIS